MNVQPIYNVLDTLLQRKLFHIPPYQRAYSWEKRQRQDLFEDISKLIAENSDRHHFMATVVCLKREKGKTIGTQEYDILDVVDGQQRLTTLILVLKAISKRLLAGNTLQQEEGRELQKLLVKADGDSLLLETNHDPSQIFAGYLKEGAFSGPAKTHSDKRLVEAIRECEKFAGGEYDPMTILRIIKNRLGFVFHVLQDEGSVYTVFEALNSRGLEVEPLDKCKSMLMGMAFEQARSQASAREKIEKLHDDFSKIYKTVGLHSIPGVEILRYSATLKFQFQEDRGKILSVEDALDGYRNKCVGNIRKIFDASNWLRDVTHKIVPLYSNPRWKSVTSITHARLLAVAILLTDGLDKEQRLSALDQWEKVTFRIYGMFRKDSRHLGANYTRLAHRVVNHHPSVASYKKFMSKLVELGEDYPADEAVKNLRGINCYEGWEDRLRYFLCRYEQSLAGSEQPRAPGKPAMVSELWDKIWAASADSTIEHIFPQTPTPTWLGSATYEEFTQHIHRLGNMLLLPPGVNAEASNRDFREKKGIYRKHEMRMIEDILKKDDWTIAAIDERENALLEWAKKEFQDEDV